MPQLQVRNLRGDGIPGINVRISPGEQGPETAIFDYEMDASGNKGWPIPYWPNRDWSFHANYDGYSVPSNPRYLPASLYLTAAETRDNVVIALTDAGTGGGPTPTPGAGGQHDDDALRLMPRPLGCSIASLVVNRGYDIERVADIYGECGVGLTTVNLLSAEWRDLAAQHVHPFVTPPAGQRYNLYQWNPEYIERVHHVREAMNSRGIVVQWCFYELYSWSRRKSGGSVPDARIGPWQYNHDGVDWVGPYYGTSLEDKDEGKAWDANMLAHVLPDPWSRAYLDRHVVWLGLGANLFLVGNEFPEKSLHERVRDKVRALQPGAIVSVNRNDNTPGQYANMKPGRDFDYLNYHGFKLNRPEDLDIQWPKEQSSVPSFRALLEDSRVDKARIIFSSDGARTSDDPIHTYDYDALGEFADAVIDYGCTFEHQSRAKMTPVPNLDTIEVDWLKKRRR